MADTADLSSLNKGISELNKNLKYLTGANLFNNAKMNEMVNASDKIRDNFEDIDDFTNDIVKKSKEEELRLKAINAIEKKRLDIKKVEREIDEKTNKIKKNGLELAERQKKLINRINKDEIEKTENLKKQTLELADQRKELKMHKAELEANLKTSEEHTKEFEKQLSLQKQQKSILSSLGSDFKRLGGNIKNIASGAIGKFLSAGMFIEGFKNLYEMSNKVYDSYWKLSVPLQKANTGMFALKAKTEEYSKALREVKFTAAKFGYDIDKIEPMINTLQDKVKYLKKDVSGKWEWDIESLADNAKQIISISKMMNMESDEMITMLEERVRRFGDTNEAALNSMHEMAAATLTFNEIMGQGSVFTEEVGKHLLELHQNTKYWVQDFGMLNTMFNSHVNLLLKQGKHQKEALALARQFQEGLQQPPELIKWKAGTRMLSEIKAKIRNLSDEDAAAQIKAMYGDNVDADAIVKAIRHSKNTGFTIANILQEMLGGTKEGTAATMGAWKSFMGFDSTVLKDMGLASSVSDAEKIKQLYKDLYKMGLGPKTTMEDAINKLVDTDKKLSEEEKEAKKKELKELINVNKGEAGKEPMSPFENGVLEIMKDLKAWLDTPMVQIAGGMLAGGAGIFKDTLSTALGYIAGSALMRAGGGVVKSGLGGLKSIGSGVLKTLTSSPGANLRRLKGWAAGEHSFKVPTSLKEFGGALKSTGGSAVRGLGKLGKIPTSTGGLGAIALGIGASFFTNPNDNRTGVTFNNIATSMTGIAEGLSLLNPIGFGLSTFLRLYQNENKTFGTRLRGALGATLLSPVESISKGVGKIFGQTKENNKLLAYLDETMHIYQGTYKKIMPRSTISTEAQERLQRQTASATKKAMGIDKFISNVLGPEAKFEKAEDLRKFIEEGEKILKEVEETNEHGMSIDDYIVASKRMELLKPQLTKMEAQEYISSRMDPTKYSTGIGIGLIQKGFAKDLGLTGSIASNRKFFIDKLLKSGRSKEQAEAQFEAMMKSYRGTSVMTEEGLSGRMGDTLALDAMSKDFLDMLKEEDKQAKLLEQQKEFQEAMAGYDKTIMENTKDQTDALHVISQKAALDMIREKGEYKEALNEFNKSNVKYKDGKWEIDGVPTALAGAVSQAIFS